MPDLVYSIIIILAIIYMLLRITEHSIVLATPKDKENLIEINSHTSILVSKIIEQSKEYLLTLHLLNEFLWFFWSSLCFYLIFINIEKDYTIVISVFSYFVLWIFIGYIIPKIVAFTSGLLIPKWISPWIYLIHIIASPFTRNSKKLQRHLFFIFPMIVPPAKAKEGDFRNMIDKVQEKGWIEKQEQELIHNVFEFGDTTVEEIMTPRTDIVGFPESTAINELLLEIQPYRFTRVPIYLNTLDNIVGILNTKDLLRVQELDLESDFHKMKDILRSVYYVPETKKIDSLFEEFQRKKIHIAAVIDEYGGIAGIVTMEDILTSLFGRMMDEYDYEEPMLIPLADNSYQIQAQMPLDDFIEFFNIPKENIEEFEDITTTGGLVLNLFGYLPSIFETVVFNNIELKVGQMEGNRLRKIFARAIDENDQNVE